MKSKAKLTRTQTALNIIQLFFTVIILVFSLNRSYAQNLVPNYSFETYSNCPTGYSELAGNVLPWSTPDSATPDYYNSCHTNIFPLLPSMDVPSNVIGNQYAKTGDGYAGAILAEPGILSSDWREYLQVQLTSPLSAGQTYCVSFYWSLADSSHYYVENMGVYFSNTQLNLLITTALPYTPQLSISGTPLNDVTNWVLFEQQYTATGGEEYIIIGNFNSLANTVTGSTGVNCNIFSTGGCFAYYYIDDVSVIPSSSCCVLSTTTSSTDENCGANDGTATANPSGGSPGYTYLWDDSASQTTQTATGLSAGMYNVTISDSSGCIANASVTIYSSIAPGLSITSSTNASCGQSNGSATATPSGGTPGYTYLWDDSTTQTTQTATGLSAGVYNVTITDSAGCTASTSITISSIGGPSLTFSSSDVTCNGINNGTAIVSASGGTGSYTYSWSGSLANSDSVGNLTSGVHIVTVTDSLNCSTVDSILINEPTAITITPLVQHIVCLGDTNGSIVLNTSGGTGTLSCSWSNGSTDSSLYNLGSGTYSVTITDANNCSDSLNVMINASGSSAFGLSSDTSICYGNTAILQASGAASYLWSAGDTTSSIQVMPLINTTYYLTVQDNSGCAGVDSVVVNILSLPVVNAGQDTSIYSGQNIQLNGSGGIQYEWIPSDYLSCDDCQNPVSTPEGNITYVLWVTDNNGCISSDTISISLEYIDGELFLPNAFSPNADGINDVLFVRGNKIKDLQFEIYDKYGKKIFETNQQTIGWDGSYKDKLLDPNVFIYVLNITRLDGGEVLLKGNVTLIK